MTPRGPEHHCPRCDVRWGGYATAHCHSCRNVFTGISAFDQHRAGSHAKGTRHCVDPASVGLVPTDREYPCWGSAKEFNPTPEQVQKMKRKNP